jgi:A/G-specific adenine glycosylase
MVDADILEAVLVVADNMEKLKAQLLAFQSIDDKEAQAQQKLLKAMEIEGTALLGREPHIHLTASAFLVNPEKTKTLMVYHNIYQALCWTGGHADGEADLLQVATKEAKEETGILQVWPVSHQILSLDILPVPAHKKNGKFVKEHLHFSVAFGMIAPEKQALKVKPDENQDVRWLPIEDIDKMCKETHMLPIYHKILNRIAEHEKHQQEIYQKTAEILPNWFLSCQRSLPWRLDREPYHVWLSEIMLQQTRIEAVMGYYVRFLETFPTVQDLAKGDEEVLLKLWEGLGYYNRARNLQKAAKEIVHTYGGEFPKTYEALLKLPGIGSYTAGAIASICFEEPVPAVDGNVLRVVSRLTEDYESIDRPSKKKRVFQLLQAVYPKNKCSLFTQSLMELGETICIPNGKPKCDICPMNAYCMAYQRDVWSGLPVRDEKKARRHENRTVFLLQCGEHLALEQRPKKGLLAGLWQFPNIVGFLEPQEAMDWAQAQGVKPLPSSFRLLEKEHIFTHIHWHLRAYVIPCEIETESFTWASENKRKQTYALPTAFRQFLEDL